MAEAAEPAPIANEDAEATPGYKAPEMKSVNEIANMDQDDEALVKYKQALLGNVDAGASPADDPRKVIVEKMVLMVQGEPDVEFDLTKLDEVKAGKHNVTEGINFKLKIVFKIHHEIVSGLKFHNVITRKGIAVDKNTYMVGSYGPKAESQEFTTKEDEMPKGMVARGHYKVKSKFLDDDKNTHLEWEWQFDIVKKKGSKE